MPGSPETFHITSPLVPEYHIVFLPGNPGCISYYKPFLAHLAHALHNTPRGSHVSVFGMSYANFSGETEGPILNLEQTISFTEDTIEKHIQNEAESKPSTRAGDSQGPVKVILMGHSLGTYIGLEIIQKRLQLERDERGQASFQIIGYVGLWATVVWLAKGPVGRKAAPFFKIPYIPYILSGIARMIVALLPSQLFTKLVQLFTGFPHESALVTADFLRSPLGVRQSLTLVTDELRDITADKWTEDIWGAPNSSSSPPRPKLVFYFGNSDHYVDPDLRDELIQLRGRGDRKNEEWRPIMEVDDSDVPHSFCIRHSKYAAEKAFSFVSDIIECSPLD